MRIRLLLIIVGITALSTLPLRATILTITGTSDAVATHQYVDPSVGYQSSDTLPLHFDLSAQPHLKNYTEFVLTATAPVGEAWLFNTSAAISNPDFQIYASTDYVTGSVVFPTSKSISFTYAQWSASNLTATSLTPYVETGSSNSGTGFVFQAYRALTASVAVTSFTIDVVFNNSTLQDDPITAISNAFLYFDYDAASDPGTLLTLVPLPEPGAAALLIAGGSCCGALRLRRDRRRID